MNQRQIETKRLVLRQFENCDAKRVQLLAGNREVSSTTANIPYPYPDGLAEKWISSHAQNYAAKSTVTYTICLKSSGELIGCVSVMNLSSEQPELGYWLGVDYWGDGYCTEACIALIEFCIESFCLTVIYGKHLTRSPASGKVMEKCGLSYISTETGKDGFVEKTEEIQVYRKICV